ncbi:DUF6247 family protein [Planomonospora sp. ID82291]|uniref:DUF6247 family protein n=1 Tax=Planomonospora sp. ID82291 TaxID=2738136 RepID=UPI0018C3E7A7|nr:DUF6247 family protein [Planomonospora sp. ID82291]MBG0819061.1 hypothetical protein [Planomonospora sp. ID82291]
MSAQPAEQTAGYDPDDILRRLDERHRPAFLADYREAMVAAAHETWRYRQLQDVLKNWHLRALLYARPGFEQHAAEAAAGINTVPAEEAVPGWPDVNAAVAAHAARRAAG